MQGIRSSSSIALTNMKAAYCTSSSHVVSHSSIKLAEQKQRAIAADLKWHTSPGHTQQTSFAVVEAYIYALSDRNEPA